MTRRDGKHTRRSALPGFVILAVAIGWTVGLSAAAHADCALGQVCAPSLPSVLPSSPADQVVSDAQNAVDQGTKAANGAVQDVNDTVNKLLNPGGGDGGGGPGGGGGGGGGGSSNGSNQGNGSLPAGSSTGTSGGGGTTQPGSVPAAHHSASHGIGGAIGHAAATFGFPLALAVLVIAFVAVQRRLDRKDPKLALARSEPDTVRFL